MRTVRFALPLWIAGVALLAAAGPGLTPTDLLKPLGEQWTSYSGDYTGRRYSSLTQINQSNVKNLTLAWAARLTSGPGGAGGGAGPAAGTPVIVGGEGDRRCRRRRRDDDQGRHPGGQRRAVCDRAGPRLGARRARRPHAVAVFLEDEGRHAHRQPRRRDVEPLSVLRHARRLLRLDRRADGEGTLAQGDCELRAAVLPHVGADDRRQSHHRRHG